MLTKKVIFFYHLGKDNNAYNNSIKLTREDVRVSARALVYHVYCSHASTHMGFYSLSPQVYRLTVNLAKEYDIDANLRYLPLRQISLFEDATTLEEMISTAVRVLDNLGPGTYMFFDHPGMIIEGEELAWHYGAELFCKI